MDYCTRNEKDKVPVQRLWYTSTIHAMDIHHLKVFASVFRNRSFSRASEELHLTQPTVSDHIRTLEEELTCSLFDRLGRTIMPTKEAELLYSHAVEIIEKTSALKEVIGEFKKEVSGELVLGASSIPGTYLLPGIMAEFKKRHPAISFQIIVSDSRWIVEKVSGHELLLGVVGARLSNIRIQYTPWIDDELVAVAHPSLTKTFTMSLKDLMKFPMVVREEGSGTRKEIERILDTRGIARDDLRIAGIFGSTDAIKQAVKAGLGISIVSKPSVTDELTHGILKEIRIKDTSMKRHFYIITHRKRTLPLAYTLLLQYLKTGSQPS